MDYFPDEFNVDDINLVNSTFLALRGKLVTTGRELEKALVKLTRLKLAYDQLLTKRTLGQTAGSLSERKLLAECESATEEEQYRLQEAKVKVLQLRLASLRDELSILQNIGNNIRQMSKL